MVAIVFLAVCILILFIMLAVIINRLSEIIQILRERFPVQSPQKEQELTKVQGSQMNVVIGGEPGKGGII